MAFGVFGAGPTQSFIIGYMLNIGVQWLILFGGLEHEFYFPQ